MLSRRTAATSLAGALAAPLWARRAAAREPVDLLLALAVDISRSVDDDEAKLQRQGYIDALTSPRVLAAIQGGLLGAIAVAYVEWAGWEMQRLVIPWTLVANPADARLFAAAIAEAPRISLNWTSISGAIRFSHEVIDAAPYEGTRRVIDVSGDGVNNSGPPVDLMRNRAVAAGITINGLPIMNDRPTLGRPPPPDLDLYYRDHVIGGQGAFMIPAEDFVAFGQAVQRKLIREIADRGPTGAPSRAPTGVPHHTG
jgi:hypothetical protein